MQRTPILLLLILLLTACVRAPAPLRGEFDAVTPRQVQQLNNFGQHVRWSGKVVHVDNQAERTCLTVVTRQLDATGRPSARPRGDQGRFIACKNTFLDPEHFLRRMITVTGHTRALKSMPIGEHSYAHPLLQAEVIYVW